MGPGPTGGVPPSQLRVSDAERHEVADLLARHFADGRLDQVELDDRVGRAMAARTRADLDGLLTDLPPLGGQAPGAVTSPPPAGPPTRRRRSLGVVLALLLLPGALSFLAHTLFWRTWGWPGARGFGPFHPHLGLLLLAVVAVAVARRWRRRHVRSS
ncbi:MAG: DUF1707 domain-containing protein [Actinomycetota bacterium]|nr:DUF1707 domain-containing protein [Actinomycetota bacterium]